ncbi:MAG: hypothetical protein KatS3mg061_3587 [Dehalococcoidia bacterium]|nr:MAG: hypothetical protein KatS3mg061_3587 [Dehalococcoidia bacterium]
MDSRLPSTTSKSTVRPAAQLAQKHNNASLLCPVRRSSSYNPS